MTPHGLPDGWFHGYNLPADDFADADLDGTPAWQEYYAGTNPTNAASSFKVIDVRQAGQNLVLTWLGGTNDFKGNWSICVSSNLTDWSVLTSKSIPRDPSGTNTWVHTKGISAAGPRFYRPCVELLP